MGPEKAVEPAQVERPADLETCAPGRHPAIASKGEAVTLDPVALELETVIGEAEARPDGSIDRFHPADLDPGAGNLGKPFGYAVLGDPASANTLEVEGNPAREIDPFKFDVVQLQVSDPNLERPAAAARRPGEAVEGEADPARGHCAELHGAPGKPHSPQIRLERIHLGRDAGGLEAHSSEPDPGRQDSPVEVIDLELGAVSASDPLDPAHSHAACRLRLEDGSNQQPKEENEGDGRQHGDYRAS